MSMETPWVPVDETENRLLEDLHTVTRRAHQDGVSRVRIASFLAFMAAATLEPADEEGLAPREPRDEARDEASGVQETSNAEERICPECETPVGNYASGFGGTLTLSPCGHDIDYETARELGWHDD